VFLPKTYSPLVTSFLAIQVYCCIIFITHQINFVDRFVANRIPSVFPGKSGETGAFEGGENFAQETCRNYEWIEPIYLIVTVSSCMEFVWLAKHSFYLFFVPCNWLSYFCRFYCVDVNMTNYSVRISKKVQFTIRFYPKYVVQFLCRRSDLVCFSLAICDMSDFVS